MSGASFISRSLLAVLLVITAGALLLPWQKELQSTATKAGFHSVPLGIDLREQIGQSGFLAALSGFRSPVAALLWIEAHAAWEKTEWGRMAALFNTVTTLQPHSLLYWDIAAWHMAWNASIAALQDKHQPSEVLRERARRQYIQLGRDFLERGIRNNLESYLLQERLGILLRDKAEDHAGASAAFAKASSLPGAPAYVARFAAYEAAKVPGMEREAYDRLRAFYDQGEKMRLPTLIAELRRLEEKLAIPVEQRIPASLPSPPVKPRP
jgi:hypothetical protein